jgi:beta-glucosidase
VVEVEELVAALTLAERCRMVVGHDEWFVPGCERLGIPGWRTSDGPIGVRGRDPFGGGLALPGPSAMAATWDVGLVEELGVALGVESGDKDVDLLLAPTVNLHRSPRAGRHFEMFSEDPELTARVAVAYVRGVQSQGVGACIKHFVGNEQEHERQTTDTRIDDVTLREAYLRPFEAAVAEADVRSVMGAYNFVNGRHACAQRELLLGLLKDEWGFDGVVVSDWGAIKETVAPAVNGLDVEMPGPGRWWGAGQLEQAVGAGAVAEADIDDKVRRILRFLDWRGRLPGTTTTADERTVDRPEHRRLARRAATESMVLLRNDGLLPLDRATSVAVVGPGVADTALFGGGSAKLEPRHVSTVLDAVADRWDGAVHHAVGVHLDRSAPTVPKAWIADGVTAELFEGVGVDGEPFEVQDHGGPLQYWYGDNFPVGVELLSVRLRFTITPDVSGPHRFVGAGFGPTRLVVDGALVADNQVSGFPAGLGLTGGDGVVDLQAGGRHEVVLEQLAVAGERPVALTDVQVEVPAVDREAMLVDAERAAAAADVAVVVVGSNAEWESEGMDRASLELPAGQDELVERVLAANPDTVVVLNCGAPMLLPWLDRARAALLAWYPGQEGGDAILDVLTGEAEPGGRMPTTWPRAERDTPSFGHYPGSEGVVEYGEGLLIGHRWYDAHGIDPAVPFGHGGSYTAFEWDEPEVRGDGVDVAVEVTVRNVGPRAGSDVVQVYVAPVDPLPGRPPRTLGAFAKVHVPAGASAVARMVLDRRSFARWDLAQGWVVDPGPRELVIAASAVDERFRIVHDIAEEP